MNRVNNDINVLTLIMVGPYYTLGFSNRPIRRRSIAGSTLTLIFGLDRIL